MKKKDYKKHNDELHKVLPNYLALLQCIFHEQISISKSLMNMGIKYEGDERRGRGIKRGQ